jgi:hypothetical protein
MFYTIYQIQLVLIYIPTALSHEKALDHQFVYSNIKTGAEKSAAKKESVYIPIYR